MDYEPWWIQEKNRIMYAYPNCSLFTVDSNIKWKYVSPSLFLWDSIVENWKEF